MLSASGSQMGHSTWLCPLRVLPCSWSPQGSCSLPWSDPGWLWEQQGHPIPSLLVSPNPHPSGLVVTQGCHGLKGLRWALKTIPGPFPWLSGAGWAWQDLDPFPTGRGTAPAWHLWGNLSLD